MLGMGSGWSSAFEPEPTSPQPADQPPKTPGASARIPVEPMVSFHGILSDYEIMDSKKYVPHPYDPQLYSSPDGKVIRLYLMFVNLYYCI